MRISRSVLRLESDEAKLSATVTTPGGTRELWYSIPKAHANWLTTDRCDGFVVGLLFQAMERNDDIVVEGPLSSRLFHSLRRSFIPMMSRAFPNLHPIKILPSSLISERKEAHGVATGFSGGIDSFATVIQHFVNEESPDHRISHFLFHNVGSHGCGDATDARRLFRQRYEKVQAFTREVGIPMIPVDSNLSELFPINFITMHPALNASIPLILQNGLGRYYYASTYKYADCGVARIDDVARFDPLAFHLFSTESIDCVSSGSQMSRVEKTELVATYEPSRRYLNVCVDAASQGRNCSVCFKCCRTLLTLELLGLASLFKDVFDLRRYRTARSGYLRKVLFYKSASFEAEIAELIRCKRTTFAPAFALRHFWNRMTGQ